MTSPLSSDVPSILVVDDSPTVLQVVEFLLGGAGYHVVCSEDGREALTLARNAPPDLCLVDLVMPGYNGYEVCQALGEDPALEAIPIVIMSNRGDPIGERFVAEMGIVDHITKPFAPEALLAVVQHTLRKTGGGSHRRRDSHEEASARDGVSKSDAILRLAERLAHKLPENVNNKQVVATIAEALEAPDAVRWMHTIVQGESQRPALAGDLRVVPIAEVLQLLSLQRQSGFLRIHRGKCGIVIAFKGGQVRLVTAENLGDEFLLGNILVREKLIGPEDLSLFLNNRRGTRRRLGAQVVQLGYLPQESLHQALRRQSSEIVYELLRWGSGQFEFQDTEKLPDEVLEFEFGLGIDELLMEGFRRVDEWGLIETHVPSFEDVPEMVPGGEQHAGPEGLTEEERSALDLVNGTRTVQEIIDTIGAGTFEGARLLYRLVAARVIRLPGSTD